MSTPHGRRSLASHAKGDDGERGSSLLGILSVVGILGILAVIALTLNFGSSPGPVATTLPGASPTRTPPRTSVNTARRRQTSSSRTRTSTGTVRMRPDGVATPWRPLTSASQPIERSAHFVDATSSASEVMTSFSMSGR